MNCSRCAGEISGPGRYCSHCGHDFGKELEDKLRFFFTLKEELAKLTEMQNSLYAAIANVEAKIQRYKQVVKSELSKMSVQTASLKASAAQKGRSGKKRAKAGHKSR